MSILKNKKNQILIFYVFLSCILLFLIFNNLAVVDDFEKNNRIIKDLNKSKVLENKEQKDSDGDGLYDWQEVLYKTDLENKDTDGDGISDGDEVKNGTDPNSFGIGESNDIEKIKIVQENILTLQKQKEDLQKIYNRQDNFYKKLEKLKEKTNLSEAEKVFIISEKKRIETVKKDLNSSGKIIKENVIKIGNEVELFNNMFLFFSPNNKSNIQNYVEKNEQYSEILSSGILEGKNINDAEIKELEKYAQSYLYIGQLLRSQNIIDFDLNLLHKDLFNSYENIGKTMVKMIEAIKKGDKNINFIVEYTQSASFNAESRKNINNFITINNIKFSPEEPGNLFVYSL